MFQLLQGPYHINHPTIFVESLNAEIDIEIVPVVSWLNSLDGVETLYSCQGDDEGFYKPYVVFYCTELEILKKILKDLEWQDEELRWYSFGSCKIEVRPWTENFRYVINFDSKALMNKFIEKYKL